MSISWRACPEASFIAAPGPRALRERCLILLSSSASLAAISSESSVQPLQERSTSESMPGSVDRYMESALAFSSRTLPSLCTGIMREKPFIKFLCRLLGLLQPSYLRCHEVCKLGTGLDCHAKGLPVLCPLPLAGVHPAQVYNRVGVRGVERQYGAKIILRPLVVPFPGKDKREGVIGVFVLRHGLDRLRIEFYGIIDIVLKEVQRGQVIIRVGISRVYSRSLAEMALRPAVLSPVHEYLAEGIMRLLLVRVKPEVIIIRCHCLVDVAVQGIRPRQVIPHPFLFRAFGYGVLV